LLGVDVRPRWRASQPFVPFKGKVKYIVDDLVNGIRSGLSYTGSRSIPEFQLNAQFIHQTSAGQVESSTHILGR
jgi:IMP dehydrogenase